MPGRSTVPNDRTARDAVWRRHDGDDWDAFDALPAPVRRRLAEHAYDPWSVNALVLWRRYRRLHPTPERAHRALVRYLDHCERLERGMFSEEHRKVHGWTLPHVAASATVMRSSSRQPDRGRVAPC